MKYLKAQNLDIVFVGVLHIAISHSKPSFSCVIYYHTQNLQSHLLSISYLETFMQLILMSP